MHASLKLLPGVDAERTPALNEAAISTSNLIRFMPDRQGNGFPQKLGGWTRFHPDRLPYTIRALHAWADTNDQSHLAIGTEGDLEVLTNGVLQARSPQVYTANPTANAVTTSGSANVDVTDTGSNITSYDSVYIETPISVGGVILSGYYPAVAELANTYRVTATNIIGTLTPATATAPTDLMTGMAVTAGVVVGTDATISFTGDYLVPVGCYVTIAGVTPSGYNGRWKVTASAHAGTSTVTYTVPGALGAAGAGGTAAYIGLPVFATTTTAITVAVSLAGHGLGAGATFPILMPVTLGGVTLPAGNYLVQAITSANIFTIAAPSAATSTATAVLNSNRARYVYYIGQNAIAASTGYGAGGYGYGGFGTGVSFTGGRVLTVIAATCTGTTATVTFSNDIVVPIGSTIIVAGVSVAGYNSPANGAWIVTASASGSLSYEVPTHIGSSGSGGTATITTWAFGATTDWSLDNFGAYLIANPTGQEVFYWPPESSSAVVVPYAPKINEGAFVAMPERQIVAYGSSFTGIKDPLLVRWSDVGNFTRWVATVTNQAGSFRIPKGSKIVGGMQGPQQGLLWTDIGLWSMQYINLPLVYSFNEVADGCGLAGRKAAAAIGGQVYWMSQSQFFRLSGIGVEPVNCPIWDVVFQDIDLTHAENIRCAANSRFGEVSWFYPVIGSEGVPTNYVKYNVALGQWDYGTLTRTAWIDQSVLGAPIGGGSSRRIQQHEVGMDADGAAMLSSFRTGYFALAEGDWKTFVDQVWPDMKWGFYGGNQVANVQITFYVTDYPGQTPKVYGPFTVSQATTFITPRFRGRLVSIEVSSSDLGTFWRLGNIRYRANADGKF